MRHGEALRLAYLVSQYPAVTHTFILREVRQLRALGFEIHTISIKPPGSSRNGSTSAEIDETACTFYVKSRNPLRILRDHAACLVRRPARYFAGLFSALRLAGPDLLGLIHHFAYFAEAVVAGQWMRQNRLNFLHVHFANSGATIALIIRKVYGIPFAMTVHGPDEFYDTDDYHLREKVAAASFICCISQFCRSQLMKASLPEDWSKMEVCALGVDPEEFQRAPKRAEGPVQIVCVGSLVPRKGQAILLAAVARLAGPGRKLKVHMVGDGPDRPFLEDLALRLRIVESVEFHGALNQDAVRQLLERGDIFVLPSFAEGVPVSLMEAMAMEIPCVSTNIAGIPELIESGRDGMLVPPSDPDLLARAIARLVEDPDLRTRMGQAGRCKVVEDYNLPENARRLSEILERRWRHRNAWGQDAPRAPEAALEADGPEYDPSGSPSFDVDWRPRPQSASLFDLRPRTIAGSRSHR